MVSDPLRLKGNYKPRPLVLILFGLYILWGFGWETIGDRLLTNVNGVIVESQDVPSAGAPRYATRYTIRGPHGHDHVFWAGATDESLPRSMPVGTIIQKQRWHLGYERNGTYIEFSGTYFYGVILTCGIGMLIWGVLLLFSAPQ